MILVLVALFGASADARAEHGPKHELAQRLERALRCTCGSCEPMSLAECSCDFAKEERNRIASMLAERDLSTDATREEAYREVVAAFVEKYGGEEVLLSEAGAPDRLRFVLTAAACLAFVAIVIAIIEAVQRRENKANERKNKKGHRSMNHP